MLDHCAENPAQLSTTAPRRAPHAVMSSSSRALLVRVLRGAACLLEPVLLTTLDQLEKALFAQADIGARELQQEAFDAMRQMRRYRADLLPAFLSALQARVDAAASGVATEAVTPATPASAWSLLDNAVVEESALLDALAARAETRAHLALHLLAHRFDTLLQREETEARALPIGPHALLLALRDASACLDLPTAARHALLRQFDRCLAPVLVDMYASANACLADAGILPGLDGYRSAPRAAVRADAESRGAGNDAREAAAASSDAAPSSERSGASGIGAASAPVCHRPAPAEPGAMRWQKTSAADDQLFCVMRDLLGNRRALLGRFAAGAGAGNAPARPLHPVAPAQVQAVLRELQRTAAIPDPAAAGRDSRRALKSLLLSHLQASAPAGHCPQLPDTHGDVVDLLDLLFEHLLRDAPARGVAAPLLARLQVPLLRVALEDSGFFTHHRHPARRLLDALAEAGLYWHDDADVDEEFVATLCTLVERVSTDFDGDLSVFEVASEQLQQQLAARMRKAAIAERRHIEAERGRERLERARVAAADAVRNAIGDRSLPGVVRNLLTRAWTDVLALTLLRGNNSEPAFARQMAVVEALVRQHDQSPAGTVRECESGGAIDGLPQELSAGLCQIGYHLDDAEALARTVFGAASQAEQPMLDATQADAPSQGRRTPVDVSPSPLPPSQEAASADLEQPEAPSTAEHVLALHERLGAACEQPGGADAERQSPAAEAAPELGPETRQRLDQLRRLPFGAWFDLTCNGRKLRCRMSWFSPVTGRCLFVNHRGQRVGDHTLTWLAIEMEQGRARSLREAQTSVVDSAWQAILGMLRSFAPKAAAPAVT